MAEAAIDPWATQRLPYMQEKLRGVGATEDEIAEFSAQWIETDWPHDEKVVLLSMGDAHLRAEVERSRAQGLHDTESEDDETDRHAVEDEDERVAAIRAEAEVQSALESDQIVEWAGDNQERLAAVLSVERAHPMPRGELIGMVEALLS